MRIRHLGKSLRDSFLPLIIYSVIVALCVAGEFVSFGLLLGIVDIAAFMCYTVWFTTCLVSNYKKFTHRKTYYLTYGITLLLIALSSILMAIFAVEPYYYFFFSPFAYLRVAKFTNLLVSTLVSLAVLFACYLIVPRTIRRNKSRRHRHRGGGPVDTNNFIMKS